MITVRADDREFILRAEGEELYYLPNILLEAPPLISVRLHTLAADSERGKEWIFHASQKKFGKNGLKGVKVSIWRRGGPKQLHLNFKVPAATLCNNGQEFYGLLSYYGGQLMTVHCPLRADLNRSTFVLRTVATDPRSLLDTMSEEDILAMFNERRRIKLREMEDQRPKRPPRDHNQWASTEAHMDQMMNRINKDQGATHGKDDDHRRTR